MYNVSMLREGFGEFCQKEIRDGTDAALRQIELVQYWCAVLNRIATSNSKGCLQTLKSCNLHIIRNFTMETDEDSSSRRRK
jgi:hypothetical protein